ncbi:virulence factor, partial [Bacillus pumilus]
HGVRFGAFTDIGQEVTEELQTAYDDERLARLTDAVKEGQEAVDRQVNRKAYDVTEEMLREEEWKKRFAHLEQMQP